MKIYDEVVCNDTTGIDSDVGPEYGEVYTVSDIKYVGNPAEPAMVQLAMVHGYWAASRFQVVTPKPKNEVVVLEPNAKTVAALIEAEPKMLNALRVTANPKTNKLLWETVTVGEMIETKRGAAIVTAISVSYVPVAEAPRKANYTETLAALPAQ